LYSLCNLRAKSIYTGNGGILLSNESASSRYADIIPILNPKTNPPVKSDPIPRVFKTFFIIVYGHIYLDVTLNVENYTGIRRRVMKEIMKWFGSSDEFGGIKLPFWSYILIVKVLRFWRGTKY
jgi:hypothetical protein